MNRRDVLAGMAAAVACASSAQAQEKAVPRIGFLHSGAPEPNAGRVARFRKGLADAGLVEGASVAIDYRWAAGQAGKLPELAADLIARRVAVLVALSSTPAAVAAHAATTTVPIFFLIAESPVDLGFAASLSRPGGNATGLISMSLELSAKRLDLLREMRPDAPVAVLLNRSHPGTKLVIGLVGARAAALGIAPVLHAVDTDAEIEAAFAALRPGTSLLVATSPFFFVRRQQLAALAARHRIPAIYDNAEYAQAGGLMSYGANSEGLWEQAGGLVARILRGERPAELPVVQAATFELIINAKAARDLDLTIPPSLLARADEVIE